MQFGLLFRTRDPTIQQRMKHAGDARASNPAHNGMRLTPPPTGAGLGAYTENITVKI